MLTFETCKKRFMQRCVAKNLTCATLKDYENFLKHFKKFLIEIDKQDKIELLSSEDMRNYFIYASNTMNSISKQGYYRRLHLFLSFLVKEDMLPVSPLTNVEKPKAQKKILPSFSSQEVSDMLSYYDLDTFIGRRNYTLMSLLLSTGLRQSEFLRLNVSDIDLNNDVIRVLGKGDKERIVPVGKMLGVVLRKYLLARKEYLHTRIDTPALFISKDGKRLSVGGAHQIFRTLRKDLNLTGKKFSAHTWRHTFAKAFLLNGGDVFTLQELLGHEDVSTTRIYVSLTDSDRQTQNAKYNPLDNTRWQYY